MDTVNTEQQVPYDAGTPETALTVALKPVPLPLAIVTGPGTVGVRMVPKFKVTNIALLPVEFLIANEVLLGKQIRAGRRDISGVEIWMEEELSTRANKF